jgi:hypothetical protein
MMKPLIVVAGLLVAALPVRYAWDQAVKRKERAAAEEATERMAQIFREAVEQSQDANRHRDFMAMLARHEEERAKLNERHDREKIADRISDNIRPGSARHHGTERWDEFQALLKKHEQEQAEFERTRPQR